MGACTWGIDQGHVVPSIQPPLFHQRRGHSLSPFVQLDTGCSAGDGTLEKKSSSLGGWHVQTEERLLWYLCILLHTGLP